MTWGDIQGRIAAPERTKGPEVRLLLLPAGGSSRTNYSTPS